jgi:hypothetical protein
MGGCIPLGAGMSWSPMIDKLASDREIDIQFKDIRIEES